MDLNAKGYNVMDFNAMNFNAMGLNAMEKENSLDNNSLEQEFRVHEQQEAIEDSGMHQFGQPHLFLRDTQNMQVISQLINTSQFTQQGHAQTILQPDSQLRAVSQLHTEIIEERSSDSIQTSQQSLGMNHRHIPLSAVGRSKKETRVNDRRTTAVRIAEDELN